MAYTTYTTDALVIAARDRGGADRAVQLFTETHGMLSARASSVREERSKMRYSLQPFSLITVTLIRGKHEWRITGALPGHNVFWSAPDRACRAFMLKFMRLIDRYITGEEEGAALYRIAKEGVLYLSTSGSEVAYRIATFRLLAALGYIAPAGALIALLDERPLADIVYAYEPALDEQLMKDINRALSVSHLSS